MPDWRGNKQALVYFTPTDAQPLDLKLTVSYKPGLSRAKLCHAQSFYKLKPNPRLYKDDLPAPSCDWQVAYMNGKNLSYPQDTTSIG